MSYDRDERDERDRDDERPERKPQKPIRYTYRYQKSVKKPNVPGNVVPKLGEIISTKAGPAKVLEVFWRSATDADVLLHHIEPKTIQEKLEAQDAAKPRKTRAPRAK